jgi:hypothetical protein
MTRLRSPWLRARSVKLLGYAACVLFGLALSSNAASQPPLEAAVKAAYIYRFLEYVAWPAQAFRTPDEAIVIGATQNDEVTAELSRIVADRLVHGRRLSVVVVKQIERDLPVHVLYVPASDAARLPRAVELARQRPLLLITDLDDGLEKGATINFVQSEGRIKFEVSLEAAARAGLTISSRLLAVATRVKKGEYRPATYAGPGPRGSTIGIPEARGFLRGPRDVPRAAPRFIALIH